MEEKIKLTKVEKVMLETFKDYRKFYCKEHGLFMMKPDNLDNKCPYCKIECKELNYTDFK